MKRKFDKRNPAHPDFVVPKEFLGSTEERLDAAKNRTAYTFPGGVTVIPFRTTYDDTIILIRRKW